MRKIFSVFFWAVLLPFWLVFALLPFFANAFGADFIFGRFGDHYKLYRTVHMSIAGAENYFIGIIFSAAIMKILLLIEMVFAAKAARKVKLPG